MCSAKKMFFSAIACGLIFFSGTHARHLRHDDTPVPMGGEKARAQNITEQNWHGDILYSIGTFHNINVFFVYKHTWIDFPDFGKKCTAYINAGGFLVESPYLEGKFRLIVRGDPDLTPQQRDDLKGVLCRLMRTGEKKNLGTVGTLIFDMYGIYSDKNGIIFLEGSSASLANIGGGTIRFSGCSC